VDPHEVGEKVIICLGGMGIGLDWQGRAKPHLRAKPTRLDKGIKMFEMRTTKSGSNSRVFI
jgi:hypothetical protein